MPKMNYDRLRCLQALANTSAPNGEMCVPFRIVMVHTELERAVVRRHIRALARQGLAEYFRGLCTEEGELAGAGYCITTKGNVEVGNV